MKKMDIEIEKQKTKKNDEPIATMVIKEYQQVNKSYAKTNKRLTLHILFFIGIVCIHTLA